MSEELKETKEQKNPKWLVLVSLGFIWLNTWAGIPLLASIGTFILIHYYALNWARKINKNIYVAYFICALLGLPGFFGYLIYYKIKKRRLNKNGN